MGMHTCTCACVCVCACACAQVTVEVSGCHLGIFFNPLPYFIYLFLFILK